MVDRLLQPLKAELPIDVTLLGMVMEVRPLQPEKAELPMVVTLLGIVTEVAPNLHLTIVLPFINNPSDVSWSIILAHQ